MAADQQLITRSVRDYFEGWYGADLAWIGQALHPDPVTRSPAEDGVVIRTRDVLRQARAAGQGPLAADRRVKTAIADVCRDVASAVVGSAACCGYVQLIRTVDEREIADALWLPK